MFGLWTTSGSAVIRVVLGPGRHCRRTNTSFEQDMEYMERVGCFVNDRYSLCHIGEWRSHHSLSLNKPSPAEEYYIRSIFLQGMSKFLVIIANIKNGDTIKLSPYFVTDGGTRYEKVEYVVLESDSPFSTDARIIAEIQLGTEIKENRRRSETASRETANRTGASLRTTGNQQNTALNSRRRGNTNLTRLQANQRSSLMTPSAPKLSNATSTSQPGTFARSQADPERPEWNTNDDHETPSEREIVLKKIHDELKYWYGVQYDSMFRFETSKDSLGAIEISFWRNDKYWMIRFPEDFPTNPAQLFNSSPTNPAQLFNSSGSASYQECSGVDVGKPLNNEVNILWAINNIP